MLDSLFTELNRMASRGTTIPVINSSFITLDVNAQRENSTFLYFRPFNGLLTTSDRSFYSLEPAQNLDPSIRINKHNAVGNIIATGYLNDTIINPVVCVSSIEGLTGAVDISGIDIGVSTSGQSIVLTNTGVTSATGGTGINVTPSSTGDVTISNTGVLSVETLTGAIDISGIGIGVSTLGQSVVLTNMGVISATGGSGISVTPSSTGNVTISNTGVLSVETLTGAIDISGIGIDVDISGQSVVLTNTGVLSVTAGSGINVSPTTGNVTVSLPNVGTAGTYAYPTSVSTDAQGRVSSISAGSQPVQSLNSQTGTVNLTSTGGSITITPAGGNINLDTNPPLSGLVPYTGATQNVNLGNYGIISNLRLGVNIFYDSSGSADTTEINTFYSPISVTWPSGIRFDISATNSYGIALRDINQLVISVSYFLLTNDTNNNMKISPSIKVDSGTVTIIGPPSYQAGGDTYNLGGVNISATYVLTKGINYTSSSTYIYIGATEYPGFPNGRFGHYVIYASLYPLI